jgi:hypothetical protein
MSPLNEIPLIGSKSEKKKVAETLLGAFPVIVRIHQADELIFPHFFIKFGSQLGEAFFSQCRVNQFFVHRCFIFEDWRAIFENQGLPLFL